MSPKPIATYRLQMCPGFGFEEATAIIKYLSDLGISHVYTSPLLQAVTDSTHGYDVVDPSKINAQLGTPEAHKRFCETIQSLGLGLMIDIVPNHMAIVGRQNPWWWDVLENGPSSRYAMYFDVDWAASEERWPNKVLLPVLGDHYGRVLDKGEIALSRQEGQFTLVYQDHSFPIDPSSLSGFLRQAASTCGSEILAFIGESYGRLPRPTVTSRQLVERRHRDIAVLSELLVRVLREETQAATAIDTEVARINKDPDALDNLIEQQNYRLSYWKTASQDLGYRRFFDIKDLVGLRIEDADVFKATHSLPISWYRGGWVQGLRIDHPDGLRNPAEYFARLSNACPGAWIVAEKILETGERLPKNWRVSGTTGYDFMKAAESLFIDASSEPILTKAYQELTGEDRDIATITYACKKLVVSELFGSDIERLVTLFVDICEKHRRHRDYTRNDLQEVLRETAACFPVYRTYIATCNGSVTKRDAAVINEAIEGAIRRNPEADPELFHFLRELLLLHVKGDLEEELAIRFQQLTGPVMAKGYEDTALYRYHRFIALNEVGGDPAQFGLSQERFHNERQQAQQDYPLSLLASTTHDTKRSEDVRARLAVLSEIPQLWANTVQNWYSINQSHHVNEYPDRNTEYLLYQTVVGAWPIDEARMQQYMLKAAREAKQYTSWTSPNQQYEDALRAFIKTIMNSEAFLKEVRDLVETIKGPGRINSLSQTLLKLTTPGVADIYQGSELWNLTLVDPDNRQPVDYLLRERLLHELKTLSPQQIMSRMDDALPKLWTIHQALLAKRKHPELFSPESTYTAIYAQGDMEQHVVACCRGDAAITIVPRFTMALEKGWGDTTFDIPEGEWRNVLDKTLIKNGRIPVQELLQIFPVALLIREH